MSDEIKCFMEFPSVSYMSSITGQEEVNGIWALKWDDVYKCTLRRLIVSEQSELQDLLNTGFRLFLVGALYANYGMVKKFESKNLVLATDENTAMTLYTDYTRIESYRVKIIGEVKM